MSYHDGEDDSAEQNSRVHENPDESYVVESSVQIQSSSVILMSHPVPSQPDESLKTRSIIQDHENIAVTDDSESTREPMRTDATGSSSQKLAEDTDEDIVYQDQNEDSISS